MAKEEEKKEKIQVDKDFLMEVLKKVEGIGKKVDKLSLTEKKETPQIQTLTPQQQQDYIFQSAFVVSITKLPTTLEEIKLYKQRSMEFQKKLEKLMKEYKMIQATAMFLKKL